MLVKMIEAKTKMQEYFKDLAGEFCAKGDENKKIKFTFSLKNWMRAIGDDLPNTCVDIKYFRHYKDEEDFIVVTISSVLDREDQFRVMPSLFKLTNDNYNDSVHQAFKELIRSFIKMNNSGKEIKNEKSA